MKAIILTRGRIATVDDEDFDRAIQFTWHAHKSESGMYYAVRNVKRKPELLHHFILGHRNPTDHRNGDGTDNRKENLRPATKQQNAWAKRKKLAGATSEFRGVSWYPSRRLWVAQIGITVNGVRKGTSIGYYSSEEEAARAYDAKARELFGEFAAPNFPT